MTKSHGKLMGMRRAGSSNSQDDRSPEQGSMDVDTFSRFELLTSRLELRRAAVQRCANESVGDCEQDWVDAADRVAKAGTCCEGQRIERLAAVWKECDWDLRRASAGVGGKGTVCDAGGRTKAEAAGPEAQIQNGLSRSHSQAAKRRRTTKQAILNSVVSRLLLPTCCGSFLGVTRR